MDKDYPVTGFIGDGVYFCLDGHAHEEYDEIRIETPKTICGRRLLCYSTNCKTVEYMVKFPEEIYQFKNRMSKLYPKAYQTYSWSHPRVHEFTMRFLNWEIAINSQFSGSSSRSTSQMDWEKSATGTAIFGPTGAALGMMDNKEN